jgi:signal transduction histidine kinase
MTASIAGAAALAAVLTVVATVGEPLLPIMMADRITWLSPRVLRVAVVLLGLLAGAMAAVWRGRRSILDLWLLLALWAWFLELSLVLTTSRRYSGGWYTGRTAGLLSGVFVLLMLLWETNRLYARLALSAVTRRREQEGRLLTMNAVAGSIAHDIKQPLTAIVANAHAGRQSIERPPVDMPELAAIFASIAQEGQDAAAVVDRIRAMYRRGGSADRDAVDVNALIRDTTTMLSAELLGHRIALHLNLEEGLPAVLADRLQVQHVFLNLFVNAIDALTAIEGRQRVLLVASSRQASTILVTVADCGTGIDPAVVDRLFEPFVTTKAQGSGMGLPLCRSIIDTHGGRVWAASRHPHGAIFHVQLPHTASAPAPADPLEQL